MTLDVFADIACPWCYIGEAHLQAALDARPGLAIERRWRPFQLQPDLPPGGRGREFFVQKFGGDAAMAEAFGHVTRAGASAGVRFDFGALAGAPNTADAHRLVLLASSYGRTWEAVDALFEGYFADGRDLNDAQAFAAIAEHAGIPGADALALLGDDRHRAEVAASQSLAARAGVRGVPFVVVNETYGISGAQPPEVVLGVLDRVASEQREAPSGAAG